MSGCHIQSWLYTIGWIYGTKVSRIVWMAWSFSDQNFTSRSDSIQSHFKRRYFNEKPGSGFARARTHLVSPQTHCFWNLLKPFEGFGSLLLASAAVQRPWQFRVALSSELPGPVEALQNCSGSVLKAWKRMKKYEKGLRNSPKFSEALRPPHAKVARTSADWSLSGWEDNYRHLLAKSMSYKQLKANEKANL